MLYIIATPIGNLEDITLRALRVFKEVDFILAEDTRKTGFLLKHFGIEKKLISFYEHNEDKRRDWVIRELAAGKNIALVSSAGTPTISDPGYKLVRECKKLNLQITAVPGASSIINTLVLTSLAHDKFIFLGYLPRKKQQIKNILEKIKNLEINVLFFESPYRLTKTLKLIKDIVGNKRITIARELTKKFEEILELTIEEALKHFTRHHPRGEFTLFLEMTILITTA